MPDILFASFPFSIRLSSRPAVFFVLVCSASPRHLHSFPTRRSSDLGQAPDPTRTIYSETTSTDPEEDPEQEAAGRPRWVVPVVIAVILLLVIGGVVAAYLLGAGDPETPPVAPPVEATEGERESAGDGTGGGVGG